MYKPISLILSALAILTPWRLPDACAQTARANYVYVEGPNAQRAAVECDRIIAELHKRYGAPQVWRAFPVKFKPPVDRAIAGYTRYSQPDVMEVVVYQPLEEALGATLDHELTHAFFFYYLNSNFDLFLNEGLAQNSEKKTRQTLRNGVYLRAKQGRLKPLEQLYGANQYDPEMALYAQSFSVVDFLIARAGSKWFAAFVTEANARPDLFDNALMRFYNYRNLNALEDAWRQYLAQGQDRRRTAAVR
ncbi:MAG: hypothetical protein Q4G03_10890 [Planctomycetia bacterium]|nr:hypothetical protein [Planctomycetia bacterium]